MGNVPSSHSENSEVDVWWTNGEEDSSATSFNDVTSADKDVPSTEKSTEERFLDMESMRSKRKQILSEKRKEFQDMRNEIQRLTEENRILKSRTNKNYDTYYENTEIERLGRENESLKKELTLRKEKELDFDSVSAINNRLRISVTEMQIEVQRLQSEILDFEKEKEDYKQHVVALKDVIKVSKQLLIIRDNQHQELKQKITEIEASLIEKEVAIMSDQLKQEYQKQLQSMRNLRSLYDERQRAHRIEKERLTSLLEDRKTELENNAEKISELERRITELENENSDKYDSIKSLESSLGLAKAEASQFEAELAVINQLFSQILLGFNNSQEIDLDKLIKILEKHHDLLQNIVTNEISSEVSSALPKVFLDLVNRVNKVTNQDQTLLNDEDSTLETIQEDVEHSACGNSLHNLNSVQEIVENLPKVWRVLIELLSHQSAPINDMEDDDNGNKNLCYKTVDTPKGPSLVLSVSKTFIRLKDLILEKRSLEKDMNNLKQLNSHLELRLQDQEKRFDVVSVELSKTWNFVGKLQKEHKMLHTQEKLLRYELAQKRKLLKGLREELEYSREKWQQAREKNSKTEIQWQLLRTEFSSRKNITVTDDVSNSVESGYSDETEELSEEDEAAGYETDVSECNQKLTDECNKENLENVGGEVSILEVIQNELENIEDVLNPVDLEEEDTSDRSDRFEEAEDLEEASASFVSVSDANEEKTFIVTKTIESLNGRKVEDQIDMEHISNTDLESQTEENTLEITDIEKYSDTSVVDNVTDEMVHSEEVQEKTDLVQKPSVTNIEGSSTSTELSRQMFEDRLKAKEDRLKRLEGQCTDLVSKVTNTSIRSATICSKLENLHETYGGEGSGTKQQSPSPKDEEMSDENSD